ncbi:MAG TPA: cyclic nucleotide-binding domain-containing protein [Tepidisphaeraceae bacterium]|nr:cyclic nucleotide-binding domain-containing protein [Tepidisphaeraceae bacterium]
MAETTATAHQTSEKTVTLQIDGQTVTVPEKTTVWEAARRAGVVIPALCHKEDLNPVAVCRVCVVDVEDNGSGRPENLLPASCTRECVDKMKIHTNSERAEKTRKTLVELLLSEHPRPCARHLHDHDCELELLGEKYEITKPLYTPRNYSKGKDTSNFSIAIDHSACILCDRCVRACSDVSGAKVIGRMGKGNLTSISFDDNMPMGESSCVNCGWCMVSCPTGAITYSGGVGAKLPVGQPLPAEELKLFPIFAKVSSQFLERCGGGVVRREYKRGDLICRQGEFGSTAYYIVSGQVDIFLETDLSHVRTRAEGGGLFKKVSSLLRSRQTDKRQDEGEKRFIPIDGSVDLAYDKPIAQIGQGELIGEAACINMQPRSATVRASSEKVVVLEMLRNVLDILRRQKTFKQEMERKYRQRALDNHLRSVSIFRDLPDDFLSYLRDRVQLVSYEPHTIIFKQGEAADAFYLVRMGHVKVIENYADGQSMVLSYLSRSQFFGEIGLLGDVERTATCEAIDHVEVVRIGKEEFTEMTNRFPAIRDKLQKVADQRLDFNKQHGARLRSLSLPQYIEQGLFQAQSLLILDLEKCTRCDECVKACAQAHDGVTRLIRDGMRFDKYLVTTSCRSCRDPYCMIGCPVGSIRRKNDLQIIIEDHCVGCGRCAAQCPYGNISMHEFEVEFTDLSTGKTVKKNQPKATVCDLCDDQCLGENEVPSCVYACPHDAAHRVDGQAFFDELVAGKGKD